MKKVLFLFSFLTFLFSQQAEITNIQASMRTDASGIIDITYDLLPDPIFDFFEITILVSPDGVMWYTMTNVTGDLGDIIEPGNGKTLTWDFKQQFGEIYTDQLQIKIEGNSFAFIDNNNNNQELPFEVVSVPAGVYTFGENNEARNINYDYEIMKYEVTDQDYVLFMMDRMNNISNSDCNECQDPGGFYCHNGGSPWIELDDCIPATHLSWLCDGENDCIDGSDEDYSMCEEQGNWDACVGVNGTLNANQFGGYYPGDANHPAGEYTFINFGNSKISWNGEIFEVEEGNVNHPVTGVTWFGAWAFATHYGMEIPDQYEWEKAARGNTGYDYPWGDELSPNNVYNNNIEGFGGVNVTFQVDISQANINPGDLIYMDAIRTKISTINGESASNDWNYMVDVNDNLVFEYTSQLSPGNNYGYLYNTSYLNGYENSANMSSCAGGPYGNERYVSTNNLTGSSIGTTNTVGTFNGQILNIVNANILTPAYYLNSCEISPNGYEASILSEPLDLNTMNSTSQFGAYDMAGNIWEIVKNDDDSYFIRGGAYNSDTSQLQSWYQESYNGSSSANNIGFRCMRIINQSQSRTVPKEKLKEYYLNKKNNTQKSNLKK